MQLGWRNKYKTVCVFLWFTLRNIKDFYLFPEVVLRRSESYPVLQTTNSKCNLMIWWKIAHFKFELSSIHLSEGDLSFQCLQRLRLYLRWNYLLIILLLLVRLAEKLHSLFFLQMVLMKWKNSYYNFNIFNVNILFLVITPLNFWCPDFKLVFPSHTITFSIQTYHSFIACE